MIISLIWDLKEGMAEAKLLLKEHLKKFLRDPDVATVYSRIGRDLQSYDEGSEASGVNTALLQVRLEPTAITEQVLARNRSVEEQFPPGALSFETGQATALGQMLGGSEADIAVRIQGEDLTSADRFAERFVR